MRQKFTPQMSLFAPMARNSIVKELEQVSRILDTNPHVLELVYEDLVKTSRPDTGRQGMTAEQVLRSAVLKQYRELTYEELAFHLEDSDAFRIFTRLEMGQYPSKSILQENIKASCSLVLAGLASRWPGRAGELSVMVRHDVAQLSVFR